MIRSSLTVVAVVVLAACGAPTPPPTDVDLAGDWRSVIESPGGELPFGLRVNEIDGTWVAAALNDTEEVSFSSVKVKGDSVVFEIGRYQSVLEGRVSGDGSSITGRWRKVIPGGFAELPWHAERGSMLRFRSLADEGLTPGGPEAPVEISGTWSVTFTDETGSEDARAEFSLRHGRVTGTFLTPTGDYRYLDGDYEAGLLRLSTFDGAHVFLFHARVLPDGTMSGDFWSRDSYHATWTAERIDEADEILPDPWRQVQLTNTDGRFRFSFPDLDGNTVSNDDHQFDGKVVLVNIFGSWCPNCNDEAPLLAEWSHRWAGEGLEIVGLAFEFSDDDEHNRLVLRRFAEHHGIDYPLLIAGSSGKADAALAVPDLSAVLSYPTTIFIGRDGTVRWIHSGFAGPGTGRHHRELVDEFERRITDLLAEK